MTWRPRVCSAAGVLLLLAFARPAGTAQASAPAESEYLRAARSVARYLAAIERPERAGLSWPVSDRTAARSMGIDAGAAGIGWFHLELYRATRDSDYLVKAEAAAEYLADQHRRGNFNGPDWLAGAAGAGTLFLAIYDETRHESQLARAVVAGDWLLRTAVRDSGGVHWRHSPSLTRIYTGKYHGAAGIGLFFVDLFVRTGEARFLATAREAALWVEQHAVTFAPGVIGFKRLTTDRDAYHHLCGGSVGIMEFLRRLWQVTGDEHYREVFVATARGLLSKARSGEAGMSWAYTSNNLGNAPVIVCHGAASAALALRAAYEETGDGQYLEASRAAASWTMAQGVVAEDGGTSWPHIERWNQFESGYQTGTAAVGHALLALNTVDPHPEYLAGARAAAAYLLSIADAPAEQQLRWINYTNEARPDWPHEFNSGWYSGAAGIGMFFIELDGAVKAERLASRGR